MKVLNFGSLNIDYVYSVDHIVVPGETISSGGLQIFCGGKGLNQSVALARAGAEVSHAGAVGEDGGMLLDLLRQNGVSCNNVFQVKGSNGCAIIQVNKAGQNSIILYGGSNRSLTKDMIDQSLESVLSGDFVLLQNETNLIDYIIDAAYAKGARVIMNPSPYDEAVKSCDLSKVWMIFVNEIEGGQIAGTNDIALIPEKILGLYPEIKIVLTLGEEGSLYCDKTQTSKTEIFRTEVVDTTAAGDTFLGYFIASTIRGMKPKTALAAASMAASLAVSRKGAAPSIPLLAEVEEALEHI
jgi:ribokinase